ncbi:MAG TPA: phosphonoacetaldehyde hydrolase [Sedimentisphaerales bacterium]|jgi:phosphonoacetaldehyde hydrolase|nr:phosphonoacetaldehyde hydrolase [Sedimentisphaerales bacterium]HNU29555.1 phosphonoacetaldehyde hydrolase [Sedimentisphaerales bacterium]
MQSKGQTRDMPIKAVISDLAGTTVDFGSCAPAGAFVELFARHNIRATAAEARGPMGIHKRDHIRAMLDMPSISRQWTSIHGRTWTEQDLDDLYEEFIPMTLEALPKYSRVIPGVVETVEKLHAQGIKIGVSTGYNNEMLRIVLEQAAQGGFVPDAAICAADVPKGRPAPWMIFRLMETLDVYPPTSVVKIGDTIADIEDGLNAGVWTVGVTRTGNLVGLTEAELSALPPAERERRIAEASRQLLAAGAHHVVDSFADLPDIIACLSSGRQVFAG